MPGSGGPDARIAMESLGAPFRYDETNQRIYFTLDDKLRIPKDYDARGDNRAPPATVDPGFLLNYSLYGGSFRDPSNSRIQFSGGNISLDARAFSKFGVFSQTAIAGSTLYREGTNVLRLESTYSFSHQDSTITGRAGDFVSNGLSWTRPVRMGGLQVQRDFTLRSDIVTRPVPVISGTAAAPSTVDVFINGLKAYSQDVAGGPYRLSNLPLMSGSGEARVVMRDATGRQTESSVPFSNPIRLLRPGLFDFSVEAGFARRNFGIFSNDYNRSPIGSATLRRGINPWLTLESHVEGGAGLLNGGAGALVNLGAFGTLAVAGSFSKVSRGIGALVYGGWEGQFKWLTISASSQRTYANYQDLASVTARIEPQNNSTVSIGGLLLPASSTITSVTPMRATDRISFSAPLKFDPGHVSLSFIHARRDDGQRNRIFTASYNRPMPLKATFFVTGFADYGTTRNKGLYAGLHFPILSGVYATTGVAFDPVNRTSGSIEVTKPQSTQDNTYGWRVRDAEGRNPYRLAQGSYRSSYGQVGGQVQQYGNSTEGNITYDGSIAVMGGGVFAGNKVNSSFAVVDAGRPGVPVLQDNRVVGQTNMFGKKMVTDLRPYEANTLEVDPSALPPNYDIAATTTKVAPIQKSGVVVNFAAKASQNAALVIFYGPDGKPLRAGLRGQRDSSGEEFIVGYDGQAYVKNLAASNAVTISLDNGTCRANFAYQPSATKQVIVDRAICR